jgi:hypothetical protein
MTVLFVLLTFALFLSIDFVCGKMKHERLQRRYLIENPGTTITTTGFELLGALAQDGGEPVATTSDITAGSINEGN